MLRVRLRHILWIFAALAVFVLALGAVAVWRLAQGPVNLALLAPHVEAALSRPEAGYRVELETVDVVWAGWDRLLRFRVSEAQLETLQGKPLIQTQGLEFVLAVEDLLSGRFVPRRVELLGVSATLRRRTDGAIGLLAVARADEDAEPQELDLSGLLSAGSGAAGADLAGFGVRGAALTVVDDIMGAEWSVPRLDLSFGGVAGDMIAEGAASVRFGGTETDIGFTVSFAGEAGGPSLSARLHGLRPRTVAGAHPLLAPLDHVTTPLSGSVTVHLDPDFAVIAIGAELHGAGGAIVDPENAERRVAVDGLAISARAVDGLTQLEIGTVEVKALGRTARLSGGGARQDGGYSAFTHLEDVPSALLSPLLPPRFDLAAVLDAPVSGTVAWTFDSDFRPVVLDMGMTIGAGSLRAPGPESDAVAFEAGEALVQAELGAGQVLVEALSLELERGRIEASGGGKRLEAGWNAHLEARAADIPVDDLRQLWLPAIGTPPVRDWVLSNLNGGRIDEARIAVDTAVGVEPELDFGAPEFNGGLSFSGVTARYWDPLPPFGKVDGSAAFDTKSFVLTLTGGKYRDVGIAAGTVGFHGLDRSKPPSRLEAALQFEGPLAQVLEVLDREPLGYAGSLGLAPTEVRGDAAFNLQLGLPLLASLALDDVSLEAEGEVVNARLPVAALETDLTQARVGVKVDKKRIAVSGGGSIGGRPATFDLEQRFPDREPVETVFTLRTTFDEGARKRLGFDLAPVVSGPVEIDIAGTEYRDKTAEYTVKAGLGASKVQLERLGWEKQAGEPAWLEGTFRRGAEGQLEASSIAAAGPGLEVSGRGRFDLASGRLLEGSLNRLRLGERTDLAVQFEPLSDGAVSIRAKGPSVDLSRYIGREDDEARTRGGLDRLAVRLDASRAWIGGEEPLHGFGADIRLEGDRISQAAVDALTANGRLVSASLTPDNDKAVLKVDAEDTGALLAALGWYRNMRGGLLRLNARRPAGERDNYSGSLVIKRFRIRNAPVLTRLLALASITGIGDALSSDAGLEFERLETPIRLQGRRIGIGPGRAFGNSIGITFHGEFDRDNDTVEIDGVLVPAYYVSRVLRKIPIIGDLLTGGGEGLFAASYELKGPADSPRTAVNPLSVLAPGFLRGLFGPLLGAEGRDWNPDERPNGRADP